MELPSLGRAGAALLALAVLAQRPCAFAEGASRAFADSSLEAGAGSGALAMRLGLDGDAAYAALGLEAKGGERALLGALRLGSEAGPGAHIAAGPGSASGLFRLLADPTSPAALALGAPVELDRSLESRSSTLELGSGPLSIFALAGGSGMHRELESAVAGLSWTRSERGGGVAALAAASFAGAAPPSSGWRPDPSSAPAMAATDAYDPCLSVALAGERRGETGAALAGLALSYGRLVGPGLGLRLEAREGAGPLSLRLAAGAAGSAFRELAGPRQRRLLDASASARLALRRASSLSASAEAQARGESLLYGPSWGLKGSLRLLLPLSSAAGGAIDTILEGESPCEGPSGGSWSLALVRASDSPGASGAPPSSSSVRLCGVLRWEASFSGLGISLMTESAGKGGLPSVSLDLSLDAFDKGKASSPVVARGGICAELPFGTGASLRLGLALPEAGARLEPVARNAGARDVWGSTRLSLRYRCSFDLASSTERRRPRSRSSGPPSPGPPKASSIAQRAAS